jgi:hypothetical protein
MSDKKDDNKSGGGSSFDFFKDMKGFYKDFSNFISKFGWTKVIAFGFLVVILGQMFGAYNMVNENTGLVALPPGNSTGMPPTADPNRYPFHRESGLLVYFYSEGTKTETIPGSSVCWGSKVNDSYNTIQSFSTDTSVTVVNGGCTFHSLSEVRRLVTKAYPSTNWVIKVDNEIIPSS